LVSPKAKKGTGAKPKPIGGVGSQLVFDPKPKQVAEPTSKDNVVKETTKITDGENLLQVIGKTKGVTEQNTKNIKAVNTKDLVPKSKDVLLAVNKKIPTDAKQVQAIPKSVIQPAAAQSSASPGSKHGTKRSSSTAGVDKVITSKRNKRAFIVDSEDDEDIILSTDSEDNSSLKEKCNPPENIKAGKFSEIFSDEEDDVIPGSVRKAGQPNGKNGTVKSNTRDKRNSVC